MGWKIALRVASAGAFGELLCKNYVLLTFGHI
jgi:hypothetical protein